MAALVRRASSSSLIPHAIRCVPFSTSPCLENCNKSPTVSNHNIAEKLENEFSTYSNELGPLPSGFPFGVCASLGTKETLLKRRYLKECISIKVGDDLDYQISGVDPFIPLHLHIRTRSVNISPVMVAKLDRLDIHEVTVRDSDRNMGKYQEYLRTKGIMPKTIDFLYDFLGFKRMDG